MEVAGAARARLVEGELSGRVLSERYRLDACIGRGQSSLVFRASDLAALRPVAIKVLAVDPDDELRLGERLDREARIATGLRHPGIVEIHEHGVAPDGLHFVVMELLGGETLAAKLARERRLTADEAVRIGAGVASALSVLHALGYVHRDLKPSNVFLVPHATGGRDVKLVDFGAAGPVSLAGIDADQVARKTLLGIGQRAIETLPGVVFGAPQYISPEQASGVAVDGRADLYSLGALIYEMLTGSPPFVDDAPLRQVARHIAETPERPTRRAPDACIPRSIEQVVTQALAKRREDRFASATEMSSSLWWALAESRDKRVSRASLDRVELPMRGPAAGRTAVAIAVAATLAAVALLVVRKHGTATTAAAATPAPAGAPAATTPAATATPAATRRDAPEVVPVPATTSAGAAEEPPPAPRDSAPPRHPVAKAQPAVATTPAVATAPTSELKDPYR